MPRAVGRRRVGAAPVLLLLLLSVLLLLMRPWASGIAIASAEKHTITLDTDAKEQLFTACQTGDKTEFTLALSNGADVNAKDMVRTQRMVD
jgi:hypothetical protein